MSFVPPMLATAGRVDEVTGDDWVHEFKWDGIRAITAITPDGPRLWSRNGNDVTAAYPELADLSGLPVACTSAAVGGPRCWRPRCRHT